MDSEADNDAEVDLLVLEEGEGVVLVAGVTVLVREKP
jgi:hypothetical protein